MTTTPAAPPRKRRPLFRWWLPRCVIGLALLGIVLVWSWPFPEDWGALFRPAFTWLIVQATVGLLAFWLLFFSGLRWYGRMLAAVALLVTDVAVVRDIKFTGNLLPTVTYRWMPSSADLLDAHRRQQPMAPEAALTLTGDDANDFPEYLGRKRDGVVQGPPLARDWKAQPPRLLWKQPAGGGYASFAVAGNVAITIEQRRQQEAVVCYNTATGHERWVYAYDAYFTEPLGGEGPRATPTIAGGDVYSLGATGMLVCLDAGSGKAKWSVNILEDNANVDWAMSGSPLVYDNVVVVNPGAQTEAAKGRALVAYDRATGKVVWQSGDTKAGYSSPMLATLGGKRQILLLDGVSFAGYDAANGAELWRKEWEVYQDINVAQPLVLDGDRVFLSSGYGKGCAMLKVTETDGKWAVETLWRNQAMGCKFTSPVAYRGHLYGLDNGILVCVEEEKGERKWKAGRYGHGQLLLSGDLLLILAETGKLVLVEATPQEHRELGRIAVFADRTWNPPALAGGKAFLRTHREMACYDLTGP